MSVRTSEPESGGACEERQEAGLSVRQPAIKGCNIGFAPAFSSAYGTSGGWRCASTYPTSSRKRLQRCSSSQSRFSSAEWSWPRHRRRPLPPSHSPAPELEAKFIATTTHATFTGRWCSVKDGQLGPDRADGYTVASVKKLSGDNWQINARMRNGGKTVEMPFSAQVRWAGDTAVSTSAWEPCAPMGRVCSSAATLTQARVARPIAAASLTA